ncbi:MAG: NUDIX hydrolase [Chlamydiales bacterium]|nr:NUDIX hydrolase [Chlamydiales bacterium]
MKTFSYPNARSIFSGRRISLLLWENKEIVVHPGAVVIVPFIADDVVLIRNERPAVHEELWELPAGTLEEGEEPLECAKRELEEETGYRAEKIEPLFEAYSTPGFSNERLFFFKATDLKHVGQNLDDGEKITVERIPFIKALAMVKSGAIHDLKTVAALLRMGL